MKHLIINEWKLWINRKNILILLLACICMGLFFHFYYEKAFLEYRADKLAGLEKQATLSSAAKKQYELQLEEEKKYGISVEKQERIQIQIDLWNNASGYVHQLKTMWDRNEQNEYDNLILELEKKADENLLEFSALQLQPIYESIYQNNESDLTNRVKLRAFYEQEGLIPNVNPKTPTVHYVVFDLLSGQSFLTLFMFGVVLLMNFNTWSYEFENPSYRLFYTQPYRRSTLFMVRTVIFAILSMLVVLLLSTIICMLAWNKYGIGTDIAINLDHGALLHTFNLASTNGNTFVLSSEIRNNLLVTQGVLILALAFHAQMISCITKRSDVSFVLNATLFMFMCFSIVFTNLSMFNQFQLHHVLSGVYRTTLFSIQVKAFIWMILCIGVECFCILKLDLKDSA